MIQLKPWFKSTKKILVCRRLKILLAAVLSWKYPDMTPFGEKLFLNVGLSTWSRDHSGLYYVGILSSILFLCGLMKLRMSLKKRQGIKILAVLILSFWIPPYIITGYQTLFAEGIYTLEYLKDSGYCSYNKEDQWVTGTCSVTFINHGTKDVPFSVSIRSQFKDTELLQDLDAIGEEKLIIKPQENKTFAINFKKVASDSNIPVSGSLSSFDISIKDGTRQKTIMRSYGISTKHPILYICPAGLELPGRVTWKQTEYLLKVGPWKR